jgi:hypothetical protein
MSKWRPYIQMKLYQSFISLDFIKRYKAADGGQPFRNNFGSY